MPGEGHFPLPSFGVHRVVFHGHGLPLVLRVVGNGKLNRAEDRHHTLGGLVEVLPQAGLQEGPVHGGVYLGHANAFTEIADGLGGIAPAAQAAEGGHPGIVPAVHIVPLH